MTAHDPAAQPEPIHWVGDAPTSLHGNGAASFARTTRDPAEVTCKLCRTLLAAQPAPSVRDGEAEGLAEDGLLRAVSEHVLAHMGFTPGQIIRLSEPFDHEVQGCEFDTNSLRWECHDENDRSRHPDYDMASEAVEIVRVALEAPALAARDASQRREAWDEGWRAAADVMELEGRKVWAHTVMPEGYEGNPYRTNRGRASALGDQQ